MSSDLDKNIERLERSVKLFSDSLSLVRDIGKEIRKRKEKRELFEALIELVDAVSDNIEDIDVATDVLEELATEKKDELNDREAGRLDRSMKYAMINLNQIGETLVTANEIAGSRFPVVIALLRSLGNQYSDLLAILRLIPTPTPDNTKIDPGLKSELDYLRREKASTATVVKRVKSKLQKLK